MYLHVAISNICDTHFLNDALVHNIHG